MRFFIVACICLGAIGCDRFNAAMEAERDVAAKESAEAAARQQAEEAKKAPPPPVRDGIFGEKTAVVLDVNKAMAENKNLVIKEKGPLGSDPIGQALGAYIDVGARTSTLGMVHAVKVHRAIEERFPTYDEFMKMMTDNGVKFVKLYRWQFYGYNEKDGSIVILEDPVLKNEIRRAAGLPEE